KILGINRLRRPVQIAATQQQRQRNQTDNQKPSVHMVFPLSRSKPLPETSIGLGPTDGQPIDTQCRLPYTDGHTLPILAAGADSLVELQIVTQQADSPQHFRTITDQCRAFDRPTESAVFDPIGFTG